MTDKKFYVISYDIVDDRKRSRAAETLKDYGQRVQKSVFEAKLDADTLSKMLTRLGEIIDDDTDSVLVYWLCEACVKQKHFKGRPISFHDEDLRVL